MKSITIKGSFTASVNNKVQVEVYRPNFFPNRYDLTKRYKDSFELKLNNLEPNSLYFIDFSGYTTTDFKVEVSGDFIDENPLKDSFENTTFVFGYQIFTKP